MNVKLNNNKINHLAGVVGGILVSALAVFILHYIFFEYDFEKTVAFFDYKTRLGLLQVLVIFVIFMWGYFMTASVRVTSLLLIGISIILGIATEQKLLYRSEPIYPSDIYFLKDFKFLIQMVDSSVLIAILIVISVFIVGVYLYYKKRTKKKTKQQQFIRLTGVIVTTLLLMYIGQFNQPGNKIKSAFNEYAEWISYSQNNNYRDNGIVSGLLYNLKSPAVLKPAKYNQKTIEKIHEKYTEKAEIINVSRTGNLDEYNVIFVMNETFSDPLLIDGVEISEDPIPLFRELSKSSRSGMSLSQGYGGGTANIEFEALTGISMEPLSSTITTPFIQMSSQMNKLPSIIKWMNDSDKALTAIHPYNPSMYKRTDNYAALGFEESIFEDNFSEIERIDKNTFISDKTAYQEVINQMADSTKKDFVHLVTMNNHKPHVNKYENVEFEVTGAPYNLEVAHYSKGLQYSDSDFNDFIVKVNELEEKTLIVFWGDHLPSFYGEDLFRLNGHLKMHETPLLFYTNFIRDERDIGTISPMYFINHVLEITNTPISPFVALLESLEQVLPAFEKGIYLERETGEKKYREELKPSTQSLLEDYEMILYDITTGNNYSKQMNFY